MRAERCVNFIDSEYVTSIILLDNEGTTLKRVMIIFNLNVSDQI